MLQFAACIKLYDGKWQTFGFHCYSRLSLYDISECIFNTHGYIWCLEIAFFMAKSLLPVLKFRPEVVKYQKAQVVFQHGPIVTSDNNSVFQSTSGGLIDESNVEEGRELGDGSFGVVRAGVWRNGNKRINVAIKTLKVSFI